MMDDSNPQQGEVIASPDSESCIPEERDAIAFGSLVEQKVKFEQLKDSLNSAIEMLWDDVIVPASCSCEILYCLDERYDYNSFYAFMLNHSPIYDTIAQSEALIDVQLGSFDN
jgi:hypothetical protein